MDVIIRRLVISLFVMAFSRRLTAISLTVLFTVTTIMAAAQIYPQIPQPQPYPYQYPQINPYQQTNPYPHNPYYNPLVVHRPNITNSTYQIKGHDFALGAPSPREKVLLHSTIFKKPGLWSNYATKEITFPPRGSRARVNITRILATDKARNGHGAFVKLASGGIGQSNVTLLFRSQKNEPINFELDIFGYPR